MQARLRYRFGPFTLDPSAFRLQRADVVVPLTPKAFEILSLLVRERHRGVTKQELLDAVWPDTAVTENTLTQRIKEVREALGDNAQQSSYIRTISRVGFQFIANVALESPQESNAGPGDRSAHTVEIAAPAPEPFDEPLELTTHRGPRRPARTLVTVAGVIGLAAAGLFLGRAVFDRSGAPTNETAPAGRIMLAILPFENLSADPDQDYLSDGLTEELITELGRLDPAQLGVIARTSAMAYKSTTKSIAEIASELGVDYLFEGSIRREGTRVRIAAQLIRASDQTHLWADSYDRDVGSILSLQSEVARAIAEQTRLRLSPGATARLDRPDHVPPEAVEAYLKGRFFLSQRTADAIRNALAHFQRAVEVHPQYAQAYAGIADAHELLASYANVTPRESIERGLKAALRALELDPDLDEPHISLGTIHTNYTWDWAQAEQAYTRALTLNSSSAAAHKGYAELLSFLGRHDQAIAEATRSVQLDPVSPLMNANLGIIYQRARRYDEALRQMQQVLIINPHYMTAFLNLGLIHSARGAYDDAATAFRRARTYAPGFADLLALLSFAEARAGRLAEARVLGTELRRLESNTYVSGYVRALHHLGLGERDEALSNLERAYDDRSWLVAMLKVDPLLDELRPDPRFQALALRLKFPE